MPREALNAIDAELEALGKRLAELPSESESESASSSSSSKEKKRKKKQKKEKKDAKKRRRKRREASSDDDVEVIVGGDDLPRIEPLPAALLPEGNDYKGKGARGSFLGKSSVGARGAPIPAGSRADGEGKDAPGTFKNELERRLAKRADRPRCEVCQMDFTSDAQYAEHARGKKHLSNVRSAAGGGGASGVGGRRYVKPPPGPHCELCRKVFTSEAQRAEHVQGKWHRQRVSGELPRSNKPYS